MSYDDDTPPAAPLRLQSMSLRGIGSYLDGARIEFAPLTILCGENGSGKSTWLRVLDVLAESVDDPSFPLEIRDDVEAGNFMLLNGHYVQSCPEDHPIPSDGDEEDFGPVGTIGLGFTAAADMALGKTGNASEWALLSGLGELATLVQTGRCQKGERFQILLTPRNPQITEHMRPKSMQPPGYQDWYEAQRFGLEVRMRGTRIRFARSYASDDVTVMWRSDGSGVWSNAGMKWSEIVHPDGAPPESLFLASLLQRAREMLIVLLSGYFHLGAFRLPEWRSCREWDDGDKKGLRYVGRQGQFTHDLASRYFLNSMRPMHGELPPGVCTGGYGLTFTVYYNAWLRYLVDIGYDYQYVDPLDDVREWPALAPMPTAFMESVRPQLHPEFPEVADTANFARYTGPTFRSTALHAHPGNFSSGFHQVAPMIVQTALMQSNEVCAIENPEVHLHPECQVRTIEFLMAQATSGRQVVIETHSDLLVKRALRAAIEGKVLGHAFPRETVSIFFAALRKKEGRVVGSELVPIELDSVGYVRHWPEGLMDTNIRETEKLADLLYGADSE